MAKKLTSHQKALRKEYTRELANARKRLKRLEKSGYVFDFELSRVQNPTKRDINRVKNLTREKLAKAGTQLDTWTGEVISTPTESAIKRISKSIEYKELPTAKPEPAPQPTPVPVQQAEPEPEDVEDEPEYFKGEFPVWNELILQRLLARAGSFTQYDDPEISARGQALLDFLQSKISEFGESLVAEILSSVLESAPDLFEDTAFYSSQIFNHTMDTLFNAFQSANMMTQAESDNLRSQFENFNELFEDYKDYDNDEE